MNEESRTQTGATIDRGTKSLYTLDPSHSVVEFAVKHMMFSTVKGRFADVTGEISFDEADPTRSTVSAVVQAASVDTRDAQRDAHLRSADFFDVERFPTLELRGQRIERAGNGKYRIFGDLTIHGVTRQVAFEAEYLGKGTDPWGNTRVGFSATTQVSRKDFGLQWNVALEAGGWLVGETVKIALEVEAVAKG